MIDDYNTDDRQAQDNSRRPRPVTPQEVVKSVVLDEKLVDELTIEINKLLEKGTRKWNVPRFRSNDWERYEMVYTFLIANYTRAGWKVDRITDRKPGGADYLIFGEK